MLMILINLLRWVKLFCKANKLALNICIYIYRHKVSSDNKKKNKKGNYRRVSGEFDVIFVLFF